MLITCSIDDAKHRLKLLNFLKDHCDSVYINYATLLFFFLSTVKFEIYLLFFVYKILKYQHIVCQR